MARQRRPESVVVPPSVHAQAHGADVRCVFEIAIYRCSHEEHLRRMAEEEEQWRVERPLILDHFANKYWTPWYYNQAIGWLRVYAYPQPKKTLDPVVNGEYFFVDAQRISRDIKRKRFVWSGEAFALPISRSLTSPQIYTLIRDAMSTWMRQRAMQKWTLDTVAFGNIAPTVNWRAILAIE